MSGITLKTAFVVSAAALITALSISAPGQKKPAKPAAGSALVTEGKKLYNSATCVACRACHKMDNKGGTAGPDLTHVGKTRKADWIAQQIRNPKKFKADGTMPATPPGAINDKQLKAIAAYLASRK